MSRQVTAALLVLCVTMASGQSGYWWMGKSGSFGGSENLESAADTRASGGDGGFTDAQSIGQNNEAFQSPAITMQQPQAQDIQGGYAGYGHSSPGNVINDNEVSQSSEFELQQPQASVVSNDINERNSNYGGKFHKQTLRVLIEKCLNSRAAGHGVCSWLEVCQ